MYVFFPGISPLAASVTPKPELKKSSVDNLNSLFVANPTRGTSGKHKRLAFHSKFDEVVEGGCVEVRITCAITA